MCSCKQAPKIDPFIARQINGLAAIVAGDIAGYSRAAAEPGPHGVGPSELQEPQN
jgi:hypothetical protein